MLIYNVFGLIIGVKRYQQQWRKRKFLSGWTISSTNKPVINIPRYSGLNNIFWRVIDIKKPGQSPVNNSIK
ncbi:hypothetical protein DZA65_00105 [Dickeya dianthicola]|uniref:hypothetical protein n=1 Tax=Dickeya dianthicola TaxID=204039 RepID=UPI00039A96ED|nr:hypothetical protein [Dickeya dianthicola]ATO35592.1 hypothetical protein DDI_4424 [Dickeya dianthicola RNS04.9]AYC17032.1 hypothetical protein DZA65_00105 [Dickeya dianthicola]MCI4029184.1 hypothetical protein [Dickeya dianthicola]MCI4172637.1 hypothetical protein [Dickeya dianthicola]MCI4184874.1 hypothetical protein [Dickeya dianthicola]